MKKSAHKLFLVQMRSEKADIAGNLRSMREYIAAGSAGGADIVCFPEMNITGYIDPAEHPEAVLTRDHAAVTQAVEYSAEYAVCVIAGFVEHNLEGKPFITQFAAYKGECLGFYRKKTIVGEEAEWFAPGGQQPVFSIPGLTFGLSVCADIDDPDIFRQYAAQGADVILESAAPGLYGEQAARDWASGYNWWRSKCIDQLGAYAAETATYIAVATQAGRTVDEDFPGGGYLFDRTGKLAAESGDWSEGALSVQIEV